MENKNNLLLYKLIRRTIVFLSLLVLSQTILFLMGNFQNFLDSSQNFILFTTCCTCIALCIFSGLEILYSLYLAIKNRQPVLLLHTIIYMIICAFALTLTIFTRSVSFLSSGIEG